VLFHYRRHFEGELNAINNTVSAKKRLNVIHTYGCKVRGGILHEDELPIRRHEGDGAVAVELAQFNALVEGDVCKLDSRSPTIAQSEGVQGNNMENDVFALLGGCGCRRLVVHSKLVVHAEAALWGKIQNKHWVIKFQPCCAAPGMPESRHFIWTSPATSLRRMAPCSQKREVGACGAPLTCGMHLVADERVDVLHNVEKHMFKALHFAELVPRCTVGNSPRSSCTSTLLSSSSRRLSRRVQRTCKRLIDYKNRLCSQGYVVCCLTPLTPSSLAISSCSCRM
jgi:hypothetical protein